MSRISEFIEYLESHIGDIYVWGAQGQRDNQITESWIRSRETSSTNAERAIKFWKKRKAEGRKPLYAFDCSGLIMYYIQNLKKWSKGDASSNGLLNMCKKLSKTQLKPGDLVFRVSKGEAYHVGVYIGDNQVIESKGRDDGVVKRDINASGSNYWNRFGELPLLQEEDKSSGSSSTSTNNDPYFAKCSGGSVYVRSGPGTKYNKLGIARKNDLILAMPESSGWCKIAVVINNDLVIGYMSSKYIKKE